MILQMYTTLLVIIETTILLVLAVNNSVNIRETVNGNRNDDHVKRNNTENYNINSNYAVILQEIINV